MSIDYNYRMKVFLHLKILSTLIIFFLLFNSVSLTLVNVKDNKVMNCGIVSKFFFAKDFSMNVVEKMFTNKMQKNKQDNKTSKKEQDTNQNNVFLLPYTQVTSFLNFEFNNFVNAISLYTYDCSKSVLDYPLKIPFWRLIFLILILKLLFSVLPRSISINYNKKNIERACIV